MLESLYLKLLTIEHKSITNSETEKKKLNKSETHTQTHTNFFQKFKLDLLFI